MYSVASTRKWPLPIAMSSTFSPSTASTLAPSLAAPATAVCSNGPRVSSTM